MNMLAAIARIAAILLVLAVTLSRGQLLGGLSQVSASLANGPRIQCEYKDIDGESLVLNCTLVTGLSSSQTPSADSNVANVPVNSLEQGLSSSGGPGSSSHLSIRVGIDKHWPTPWEQLYINRNIIRTVIWRNSRLTEIGPYAFKELTSFQRLDLSYNRLTVLNSSAFKQQEVDLIDLDLSHNMFTYIPGELFENKRVSRSLETLRMNENPITAVTKGSLQALRSSLRLIELNYCQIRAIDIDAFDGMQQLESISLVGNHLRHLNQHTFADLTLRSFYVHENPLVCDCHMRWLIDYLKTVDYQQQSYESQLTIVSTTRRYQAINMNSRSQQSSSGYMGGTMSAAQNALRCDQPNSLKSKPNFLEINPDSFMCDIQLSFRDNIYESTFELGEDAVLVCDVYGDPEPEVYWSFGQRPIEKALSNEIDKYYVTEMRGGDSTHAFKSLSSSASASRLSNKTSELRIRDLQPSDMGLYTCTAEIKGSNNRKQIVFSVKQVKRAATSLSNAGDMFINGVNSALTQLLNVIANLAGLQTNSGKSAFHNANQAQSISSTLALLVSILISICVFLFIICVFTCWRLRCCCCRSKRGSGQKRKLSKADMKKHMMMGDGSEEDLVRKEQQEKLLSASGAGGNDQHDGQSSRQNYVSLVNDSSATLLSSSNGHNTKASNSIRMAYPNYSSQQHNHLNDIYANHSLLTTTSSATCVSSAYPGPLPPPPPPPPAHAIAIDTSNHTPRYHLLQQQQQQQIDCYYDDLRYNGDEIARISPTMNPSVIYSSPYRHNSNLVNPTQSYSPIIRRDDPTVPLYATLKPKLIHHQQQQQQHQAAQINRNLNNYVHYSTIHRTQVAPAAKPRQFVNAPAVYSIHPHHQMLPPPPPPPPAPVPPVKPKRTFEYVVMGAQRGEDELNSESGAFLLDQASVNENELNNKLKLKAKNRKKSKHYQYNKDQGSTTSLDEDLDLNDLKDFEDVTFDNLRKPGEDPKTNNQKQQPQKPQIAPVQTPQVVKPTPETATITEVPKYKTNLSIRMQDLKQDTNSEQSLLLKSSSSSESKCSSDNTINNICAASNSTNTTSATNASNELRSSSEINAAGSSSSSSSSSGSNVQIEEQTIQTTTGKGENVGGKTENNLMENVVDELSSKIYEETEI